MSVIIALLSTGLGKAILAALAGLVAIAAAYIKGKSAGKSTAETAQKAKAADAYAKHIQDIERAAGAQPRVGVPDDPYNRDR